MYFEMCFGIYLGFGDAFGMHFGIYLGCVWDYFGMYLRFLTVF